MRILILGLAKSGTTGLFYRLANTFTEDRGYLHEFETYRALYAPRTVTKVIISPEHPCPDLFRRFDKRILLTRDPRDRLVSLLLYYAGYHFDRNPELARLLKAKQASPGSVSMVLLMEAAFGQRLHAYSEPTAIRWHNQITADFHRVRYEDFVAGTDDVEAYVGEPLTGAAHPTGDHARVVRTKGRGDFRNWFTPRDVEHYRRVMSPYMDRFGYGDDWALNPDPVIDPRHCLGYYESLCTKREARQALRSVRAPNGSPP